MTTAYSDNHIFYGESTPPRPLPYKERFRREATLIADSREQQPYLYDNYLMIRRALPVGDYSIEYHETLVAIERKSLEDYLRSITTQRKRFMAEIKKLSDYYFKAIIVEGSWNDIVLGDYPRSQNISIDAVIGTTLSIQIDYGVPVIWLDNRQAAQRWVLKFLERAWKHFKK